MSESGTTTIRVSREINNEVKSLAQQENENIQNIISNAVKEYKKKRFFENLNSAYMRLKATPDAWKEELEERDDWDSLIADGLENYDADKQG